MEGQIFKDINTELDLNGPYLSYTTQPSDQTPATGASVSFTGLSTVSYGASVTSPENVGTVSYQWYEVGVGALSNSTVISGATTGTLTLASVTSGVDDNRQFYLESQYTPSQIDYETGNPSNEPLNSDTVGMTIEPNIQIISQPVTRLSLTNTSTTFTVGADLTDGTTSGLQYQWYIDGVAETNRTKETTVTGSKTVASPHSFSWTGDANHTLPNTAYDITTTVAAARGGNGGNDSGGNGAPGGQGRGGDFSLEPSIAGKTLKYRIGSQGNPGPNGANTWGAGGVVSGTSQGQLINVNFSVSQSAGCSNIIYFGGRSWPSGNTGTISHNVETNIDYQVTTGGSCPQQWLQVQDGGRRIGLDDSKPGGDNDYNDLQISASQGKFSNANRSTANYRLDGSSVGGTGSGTRGGGSGHRGWSGGGGGAGAASYIDMDPGGYIIVAGGGAGGGGGSWNRPGIGNPTSGNIIDGKAFSGYPGPVPLSSGQRTGDFDHTGGDGGGSGGGGGGSPGGNTGNRGWDNNHGGYSGNGGGSRYDDPLVNLTSQFTNNGNGWASLSYMSTTTTPTTEIRKTVISGVNTPTLTLSSDYTGVQNVYCVVSHGSVGNSPQTSDTVTFSTIASVNANMVKVEHIDLDSTAALQTVNLNNGDVTFDTVVGIANAAGQQNVISLYAPDKDIVVQMDLYGGIGRHEQPNDPGRYSEQKGGEGGYSRIQFTMTKNQEYVIAGLSTFIGAPSVYRGANLIATVGQGGAAGNTGDGGDGGGVNIGGEDGLGGGGMGGSNTVQLSGNGKFGGIFNTGAGLYAGDQQGTGTDNGKMIICPKGVYWRQQGKSQCASLGTQQYRLANGTLVSNTASITRGYKAGYNIVQTAGAAGVTGGRGGCGRVGGSGGQSGGGGGGSGYADTGVITIKDAKLGGSTGYAKVVLRVVP